MHLDSVYVANYYVNEPDATATDFWNLISVTDALLRRTATLIRGLPSTVASELRTHSPSRNPPKAKSRWISVNRRPCLTKLSVRSAEQLAP